MNSEPLDFICPLTSEELKILKDEEENLQRIISDCIDENIRLNREITYLNQKIKNLETELRIRFSYEL